MARSAGVLLSITSLPSPYGIGTIGKEARKFADYLKKAGQKIWQILPVGPTSYGDSPYQSFSTYAGNPYLIDLDTLCEEGLLTKEEIRENDALLSFLFTVNIIVDYFTKEFYGEVFRIIRKAGTYFNYEKFIIRKHIDKHLVKDKLDDIVALYNELSTTVDDFLSLCVEKKYIREEFYSAVVEENDYKLVKNVKVQEVKVLADYMSDPKISTQHGVKGESHDTVVFVADNSRSNPVVHMSKFFEMWSNIDITLSEFDAFYYIYSQMLNQIENKIGMKCSQLKADTYISVASIIDEELQVFTKKNETNPYYIQLLKVKMDKYFGKKNVTNVKECLKEGTVYGPLCAYRLFYVGCSRAKRNLVIMINKKDIEGFEDKLRNKLMITGFNVL